jgi:hypothetical protein
MKMDEEKRTKLWVDAMYAAGRCPGIGLEKGVYWWETPSMSTVVADSKKRVTLRHATPGDRFDVQFVEDGTVVLTRLEPVELRPAKIRIEKRGKYHVGVSDRPINMEAVKQALEEFP